MILQGVIDFIKRAINMITDEKKSPPATGGDSVLYL